MQLTTDNFDIPTTLSAVLSYTVQESGKYLILSDFISQSASGAHAIYQSIFINSSEASARYVTVPSTSYGYLGNQTIQTLSAGDVIELKVRSTAAISASVNSRASLILQRVG